MTTAPWGTRRTLSILRYIETFWAEHGYAPSVRDIQRGCGMIGRVPGLARTITVLERTA